MSTSLFAYFENQAHAPARNNPDTHGTLNTYRGGDVHVDVRLGGDLTITVRRYPTSPECHAFAVLEAYTDRQAMPLLQLTIANDNVDAATLLRDELTGLLKFLRRQERVNRKGE